MQIVQLMASPFVGGPERQVLGLARALSGHRTTFLSFAERGLARPLLEQARADGFEAIELASNFPRIDRAIREVADHLRALRADILCTSGYKPDLIGWRAARRAGIPVVAIAHGWTGVTFKVRVYEWLDALAMRAADAIVCVSEATAQRVQRAGVPAGRCKVIRNALDTRPYDEPCPEARRNVEALFGRASQIDLPSPPASGGEGLGVRGVLQALTPTPSPPTPLPRSGGEGRQSPPTLIVGAVGRLSPEKGFDVLIDAAAEVVGGRPDVGFVLFGDGPLRGALAQRILERGLGERFVLAGFRTNLEQYLPGLDIAVSSSHTEGLPVAILEAMAAGVPIVATAVGGTPEVVLDGITGILVPPAHPAALAAGILDLLSSGEKRNDWGQLGAARVRAEFTFPAQAARYEELFAGLCKLGSTATSTSGRYCHARG